MPFSIEQGLLISPFQVFSTPVTFSPFLLESYPLVMGPLSIGDAQLPALLVESIFYGIHIVTFFTCIRGLLYDSKSNRKPMRYVSVPMIFVVSLIFASSTLYLASGFIGNMEFFIYTRGSYGNTELNQLRCDWLMFLKVSKSIIGSNQYLWCHRR